jgi:Protein of unknown function (DUF3025)
VAAGGLSTQAGTALAAIDWRQPWLQDWRECGQQVAQRVAQGAPVCEALNSEHAAPLRFVSHSVLPAGQAYEDYIFQFGDCPTRDNLHDFFNGLCWLQFPHTKQRLNALQAEQIATAGIGPERGAVRDAITVFDENAAFFMGPGVLWDALLAREWRQLFVEHRSLWVQARLVLFGHALLEKLVTPRKAITAHVYRVPAAIDSIADLDTWVAQDLSAEKLGRKPFAPLPVLGVPQWWPANEDPAFYADQDVFRPKRTASRRPA